MKNWLTQVAVGLFAVAALTSCEKDEEKATIKPSNTITLTASTNRVVLVQANATQAAVTFNWTPISSFEWSGTDKPGRIAPSYQLQFSKTADNFGYPSTLDAGNGASKAVTVSDLNTVLVGGMGLAPGTATTIYARVAAVVGSDTRTYRSEPVAITVTPYRVCLPPNADVWALVGPAGNGWPDPAPAMTPKEVGITLTWDCVENAYMARTMLSVGEFKFRKDMAWTTNLGGPPTGDLTAGVPLTLGGPNLRIATAGTYTVKLKVTGSGTMVTGGMVTVVP